MTTIRCRARVAGACYHGQPSSVQFGEDGNLPLDNDGTYTEDEGGSIVCDPCYIVLMPLTPSGRALIEELPDAIRKWRETHDA